MAIAAFGLATGEFTRAVRAQDTLPRFTLEGQGSEAKVTALTNLYTNSECHKARTSGIVVRREFGSDALRIIGIILEHPDGHREHINVEINLDRVDMATRGWVTMGVQTLLREGTLVELGIKQCGVAGRILFVDEVQRWRRPAKPIPNKGNVRAELGEPKDLDCFASLAMTCRD
jgi:hypothetical protein